MDSSTRYEVSLEILVFGVCDLWNHLSSSELFEGNVNTFTRQYRYRGKKEIPYMGFVDVVNEIEIPK